MIKLAPFIKQQFDKLASASVVNMGNIIVFTSVAGWLASSAAQIIGIANNKNYTNSEKKFMISQEAADACVNIGAYFLITKSLTALSSKLVSTAKLAPKEVISFMRRTNNIDQRGDWRFDVSKAKGFTGEVENCYNNFKCFTDSAAAITGGIISSNIVTPILRNKIASHRHNKYVEEVSRPELTADNTPRVVNTPRHTFEDYRTRVVGMKI